MYLIVDTYNVLHTTGVLPPDLAGVDVSGLARLILGSRYHRRRSLLVCDGAPERSAHQAVEARMFGLPAHVPGGSVPHHDEEPAAAPRIAVHYAGPGRDADTVIHGLIRASSTPARLTIVSTDREIRRHAVRRRARSIDSESFLKHLAADFREAGNRTARGGLVYEVPLDSGSIDWWLQFFRIDDGERHHFDQLLGSGRHRRRPASSQATGEREGARDVPVQPRRRRKPTWWSESADEQSDIDIDIDSIDTGDFID